MNKYLATAALSFMLLGGTALAQTSATGSGSVTGNAGVSVGGTDVDAGVAAGASGGVNAGTNDTSITGSTSADASTSAAVDGDFMDSLGDSAVGFFSDSNNGELRSDTEVKQNFAAMTDEQRTSLRSKCGNVDAGSGHSKSIMDLCGMVSKMKM